MDSQSIRTALGLLQEDPENELGWQSLTQAAASPEGDLSDRDLLGLLDAARERHRARGEWDAVAQLLELASEHASEEQVPFLLAELARVQSEELLEEEAARVTWGRLIDLVPDDASAIASLEESQDKGRKWKELVQTYAAEAEEAPDEVYKSSMLMRAAEVALRYGGGADRETVIERLEQSVRLDTNNARAVRILDRLYRRAGKYEDAARVLERHADRADEIEARVQAGVRLARLYLAMLDDKERSIRAYQRVLKVAPEHREAKSFLSDLFAREERWEELVRLYERDLAQNDQSGAERLGDMLQIAMLYWRNPARPADAEPWFERVRRLEPAHPAMLSFYREYLAELEDDARLMQVLQAAQRAAGDDDERARIGAELAKLSEGQKNAQKAIEQYKSVLRHDPDNAEARDALKRLYKQTEGYNALVELLRQQLERTPQDAYQERLAILREVAGVYRTFIKSDTALVSVLNQIVQLDNQVDAEDVTELRELVLLAAQLRRWRDLLTWQLKLAEVTPDVEEKKVLYRAAGERWLEQFTNVQNATEAYERLLELVPDDTDARQRLEQLYRKRRAWPALYRLFEGELRRSEGAERIAVMREMAALAADRLNRPEDAVRLYQEILDDDPSKTEVLDALEKHAERTRNWSVLAEALERRVDLLEDPTERVPVLQKLGTVYADHLEDAAQATRTWRRVLELQPGHHRALRVLRDSFLETGDYEGLEELYASQDDFEALAEVLSNAADRAQDPAVKVDLSYRAAAVYVDHLDAPDRAFRSYERVLATDPTDVRAARALVPLYEADEKWARLPALYETMLDDVSEPAQKLELLEKLVEVTGARLSDRRSAVEYARRAYEAAPASALELLETAARQASAWDVFVAAVTSRLKAGAEAVEADEEAEATELSAEERRQLELRLAAVYAEELGRSDEAIAVYRRLLERDPSDPEALSALEAILRREDRRDELRWLLDLRVEHAPRVDERVRVLVEWALLEEEVFEAPDKAVELYRRVLALDGGHATTLRALPRLLLAADDPAGAVAIIEQDRDRLSGDVRAAREVELAGLYLDRLGRLDEALEASVRALELVGRQPEAMEILERLQQNEAVQARAAAVLAVQYASANEPRREARSLDVMIAHAASGKERLPLYERLAEVYERKLESYSAALDAMLKALQDFPTEMRLWDRCEDLAAKSGRPTDLAHAFQEVLRQSLPDAIVAELSERAARLHEERLGDPIGATPYLEKVLSLDPRNESAFQRLKDILTAAERWGDLEVLYDRASQATTDPARRTDMLTEVALISEEIVEDPAKATMYYERILEIEPQHDAAIRALDRLYAQQDRDADLAALLERRTESAVGDELLDLELRLASISLEKLHEPEQAIGRVEHVLNERPNDYGARDLAEKLLSIRALRARAARMLELVYEQRDEIRDLVRVLVIRLEEMDAALQAQAQEEEIDPASIEERRELLRRIALLRDDRLHDDEGAFDVLARLVPEDPDDPDARERLLEIGRRLGAHQRLAEVLEDAAKRASTPALCGEILLKVASIYEDQIGDTSHAERIYRQALNLDATDAELVMLAARALERIYLASDQHRQLAEMLRVQVRLEQDPEVKRTLLGRLGDLCQNVLEDDDAAIEAWKERVEENSTDDEALAALDALYEKTERWRELVGILARRADVAEAEGLRRTLMVRSATTLANRLDSVTEAIEAWRAVVDEFGPDEEALQALERLLRRSERWDELADTYERHLDVVDTDGRRLDLLVELGNLRREHLSDTAGALDAYRQALGIDPAHAPSRAALEVLLEADDHVARREAAEVLHPLYEADADHQRLLQVLEIEIDASDDPAGQLEGLEKAIDVAEAALGDAARAFGYAQRALRTAVTHTDLGPWLSHVERLANATGGQAEYVRLLCDVVSDIFDGEVQVEVMLRIADLARHQLLDRDLAREYYTKTLEVRADDPKALVALESLYEEAGDAPHLLEILERRVEVADTEDERRELLFRRARLLAEVVGDKARAIHVYEEILDIGLDATAIAALEALYTDEERWADLVSLYERQLDGRHGEPAPLHVKIAIVAARYQNDVGRAFDELERALEIERQQEDAIAELERMLSSATDAEHRSRAATLLEPVYLMRSDYQRVMEALRARLDFSQDPEERRELLGRLAQLHEEQQEDYAAALETTALLLHEDLADRDTVAEVERLAKVAGAEQRLAEIYAKELAEVLTDDDATAALARRTGELFNELGDAERALTFLRRALAFEPENVELFTAIDEILERTEQHEARVDLYRGALDHRFDPADRSRIFHTVAALQRNRLGLPDEAIETYRSALDVDDQDAAALDALTELFAERRRWEDLAELFLRRAETASSAGAAAGYRLSLARLYRDQFGDAQRAIDQLDEIVRDVPDHGEAIQDLEAMLANEELKERVVEILRPLYQQRDDWRHTIRLNEERFALAEDVAERVGILRETAELWEDRGQDPERARRALRAAVELDPDDLDVRQQFERLTERTDQFEDLAATYDQVLEAQPELASKRDVLAKLAEVCDQRLDDPRRALEAFERLHQVDEGELEPLEKMEQLAMLLSDWAVVVRALTAKAELLLDDEQRASVWRQVGEAKRDMLEDPAGAVEAYERALELDGESTFTIDCLLELYETREETERLVELYQRRVELAGEDDDDLRYDLLFKAAVVYEERLRDRLRAIEVLNQALGVRPGDRPVLAALDRLYRAEELWPELLDNLRLEASTAESVEERARLRREIGATLAEKLHSYDEALEAYRLVLDESPRDDAAIAAVRAIGERHEDLRESVAGILVPVLRSAERFADLVDVLEMRLTVEGDPVQRCETLRSVAEVLETHRSAPDEAHAALLRALSERPEDDELHRELERLSGLGDGWGKYADALGERAGATFDPELVKDLYTRLGAIAERHLGDDGRAIEAYARALEQTGDDFELLESLDRLYTKTKDYASLAEVLDRRVAIEERDETNAELHFRLAEIQIQQFDEPERGLGSLRAALERDPAHEQAATALEKLTERRDLYDEAAEVLESVYRARGAMDRVATLYEKRVGFALSREERIDARRNLARVLEDDCSDPAAAQRALQAALPDDPADSTLLDELERLAPVTGDWNGAAEALRGAIDAAPDLLPDVARELCTRLASWLRDRADDRPAAEQALLKALDFDPNSDEVLVLLEELQREAGRERDLIATLRRRARLTLDDQHREDLYRSAKELADGLQDAALAEELLRELLGIDDVSLWALAELTQLREDASDYAETFELLVRRSELRASGQVVQELRHRAAALAREQLNRKEDAVELYEALFEDDPNDDVAATALRALFNELERWDDLGRLLERLVDLTDDSAARCVLRVDLARLNAERFQALDAAIDQLRLVLDEESGHAEAVVALSELLEQTQRDEELAELLASQIEAASQRGDQESELRFQVRLAEVCESRLNDRARAIETYRAVLERNGEHRGALEALARLYELEGSHADAAEVLDRLLSISSGPEAVELASRLADVHGKLDDKPRAVEALERGLEHDRSNGELRQQLRALYTSLQTWDKLAELLAEDAGLAESPAEKTRLLREAAEIHAERRSDQARAAELLEQASELIPDDRNLLMQLCDAYSACGRASDSIAVLERIVESYGTKRGKELAEIHRRLADAYVAQGQNDRALAELDKAFRMEPGNVNVLTKLGRVALEAGDLKKAQQMFRALLLQRLDAKSPITKAEVFLHLGEVHQRLGETPKAKQMYERAIQADDSLELAKQRLSEL